MTRYKVDFIIWGIFCFIDSWVFISMLFTKEPSAIIPNAIPFGITIFGTAFNIIKYVRTKKPKSSDTPQQVTTPAIPTTAAAQELFRENQDYILNGGSNNHNNTVTNTITSTNNIPTTPTFNQPSTPLHPSPTSTPQNTAATYNTSHINTLTNTRQNNFARYTTNTNRNNTFLLRQNAENARRILTDCMQIIITTSNPETFFHRYDLLLSTIETCFEYEKQGVNFGFDLKELKTDFLVQKEENINVFLINSYTAAVKNALKLKTQNGIDNRLENYFKSLIPYESKMYPGNLKFIEKLKSGYLFETVKNSTNDPNQTIFTATNTRVQSNSANSFTPVTNQTIDAIYLNQTYEVPRVLGELFNGNPPTNCTGSQLMDAFYVYITNSFQQMEMLLKSLGNAIDPNIFFHDINVYVSLFDRLVIFKNAMPFPVPIQIENVRDDFINGKANFVDEFITRSYKYAENKLSMINNQNGRSEMMKEYFRSMLEYKEEMLPQNIVYLNSLASNYSINLDSLM